MPDPKNKGPKREIDRIRENAGSMSMNVPGDDSEITGMLTLGDSLLVVKRKGIYQIKMADQIDPERTNPNVPNTVQRLAAFGSDEEFIGKILLTAHGLLEKGHLSPNIDANAAMGHAAEITKNVAEMRILSDRFASEEQEVVDKFEGKIGNDRSLMLPSMVHVDIRVREFIQKADHALQRLLDLTKLFYSDLGSGGWEGLKSRIEGEGRIDNFEQFLSDATPFLRMIRSARNAVEHERPDMKLIAADFALNSKNQLVPPLVQLVHLKTPFEGTPIRGFMSSACANIADIVELMIVFLCARHVGAPGNLSIRVIEIPIDRRFNPNVRYGFGVMIAGQLVPLS
ncbi:MAG: hypothetical protein M9884_16900 [Rhodocyclaceae bacterium]|jgi:hypothetical protein|nr:hypothetical protein [Rhodocyclaceae bacterium]MCO5099123.1 hypothetical protein [Rhodocyclaceae bacterium]